MAGLKKCFRNEKQQVPSAERSQRTALSLSGLVEDGALLRPLPPQRQIIIGGVSHPFKQAVSWQQAACTLH